MPVYSQHPKMYPGAQPFPYRPCYGLDGNGEDIGDCVMVDTDTGWVEWIVLPDGGDGQFVTEADIRPLPIRFITLEEHQKAILRSYRYKERKKTLAWLFATVLLGWLFVWLVAHAVRP